MKAAPPPQPQLGCQQEKAHHSLESRQHLVPLGTPGSPVGTQTGLKVSYCGRLVSCQEINMNVFGESVIFNPPAGKAERRERLLRCHECSRLPEPPMRCRRPKPG